MIDATSTGCALADRLADTFAGLMPAPGGLFKGYDWSDTDWGPVLADAPTWAGARVDTTEPLGWALLVTATIKHIVIGAPEDPLIHHHGRYHSLP